MYGLSESLLVDDEALVRHYPLAPRPGPLAPGLRRAGPAAKPAAVASATRARGQGAVAVGLPHADPAARLSGRGAVAPGPCCHARKSMGHGPFLTHSTGGKLRIHAIMALMSSSVMVL
jgi:hypothetical protein